MRNDVATILAGMGHVSDRDFVAFQIAPGNCDFTWLAGTTRPTEAEIEAAAPGVLAARTAQDALLTQIGIDKADLAAQYAAGIALLDSIATATIPATFANNTQRDAAIQQIAAAVKNLATIQRRMLKVVRALVI